MSRYRHEDSNRVVFGTTPLRDRLTVDRLRRRATWRKLLLMECAILRYAPFADCGRTIWDLLPTQRWFGTTLPPAEWYRLSAGNSNVPPTVPGTEQPWPFSPVDGHQAIEWFEGHPDGTATDDQLLLAKEYFRHTEWAAEADRFDTPDEHRDELEVAYGVASWLLSLGRVGAELWNVLDFYLANYTGQFYRWAGWRPLHPEHRPVVTGLIKDILGDPFRPEPRFEPSWRTDTVVLLAHTMYAARDFSAMPILADALQDAGCNNDDILNHCRDTSLTHVRGCWVVDSVLGKE